MAALRRLWLELVLSVVLAALAGLAWSSLLPWRGLVGLVSAGAALSAAIVVVLAVRPRPSALRDLVASAVGYVLLAGALLYRSTTMAGLPTLSTLRAIGNGLVNGLAHTLASSVPAPPVPSIRLVPFTVAWLAALWGTTLTIRSRSVLAPSLVAVGGFVLGVLLSGGRGLLGLAGAVVATLILFTVVRVARLGGLGRWTTWRRAVRFGVPAIAVIAVVSVGIASLLSFSSPAFDLHDRARSSIDPRSALTPLRQIQARVSQPKPVPMFDVRVDPAPSVGLPNFRLSVLDHFDGSQWSSSEKFVEAASVLPPAPRSSAPKEQLTLEVTVHDLDGFWLPALATPVQVSLPTVELGGTSGSLATPGPAVTGLHYTVTSTVAVPTPEQLQVATPDLANPESLALPSASAEDVLAIRSAAEQATAGVTGADAQLNALQHYLTAAPFHFSFQAPAGQSYARIRQFLTSDHAGTSEQFATAFALMARSLGLPTRVVAGFRHGALKDGAVSVTSADAYAWTEVHLSGLGWVSYDSTPFAAQPATTPTTTPGSTVPDAGQGDLTGTDQATDTGTGTASASSSSQVNPAVVVGLSLLGLVLLIVVVLPVAVVALRSAGTRRRRRAPTPEGRTLGAWRHAVEPLRPASGRSLSTLTVAEISEVADEQFGEDVGQGLGGLGTVVNRARFDPRGVAVAEADAAWVEADAFRRETRRRLGRWARVVAAVDPRTLRR
jgi:transglutaminase-like putative cysteine protease